MKTKRVLISYLNNGNIESQVSKELMFNKVVGELVSEGRGEPKTSTLSSQKVASFKDGSKVFLEPFGKSAHGIRLTHLYLDKEVMSIPRSEEVITFVYLPFVINGEYENWDTEGSRIFTYSKDSVEEYNKNNK